MLYFLQTSHKAILLLLMQNKSLIFLSFLYYICNGGMLTQSFAASIPTTKEYNKSNKPLNLKHSNKKDTIPAQIIQSDTIHYPLSLQIQLSVFTAPSILPSDKKKLTKKTTTLLPYSSLYEQGKEFFIKNKDSELLQSSLITFSQTKQYLKETDLMLHNLTQDILFSLGLSNHNQNSLFLLNQKKEANKLPANNYRNQIETLRTQNLSRKQEQYIYSDSNLFQLIFNLRNLYYLIAIVVFFYSVKKCIKLMFLKKQFDSQNRR